MRNSRLRAPLIARLCFFFYAGLATLPAVAGAAGSTEPTAAARAANDIAVGASSSEVLLPDGERIEVFTYRAAKHGPDDPIVIVLPGGGRNGDDYRDSWIAVADRFNLLVLAPSFDEAQFPGAINYNLAGMIRDGANVATLRNVDLTPPRTWLFADIETIFDEAVARTGSAQTRYDLFGHSAGAQIIHRMVLFAPEMRVRKAVAANSGWYTTLKRDVPFPYGIEGVPLPLGQIDKAFRRKLVLFLGELDNAQETRGNLRETPEANAQGEHRLARGRHFHALAGSESARLGLRSNWALEIVPGVGHDYRRMGEEAADYLYAAH